MKQASRFRWMHPSLPGLKCCCAVASSVTNGVVGQGSKCSKASVIPGKCSSLYWLSDKSHTAQCTQLFRPAPPDGFHCAGEVTTLNSDGRQKKISRIFSQNLSLGLSSVALLRLETTVSVHSVSATSKSWSHQTWIELVWSYCQHCASVSTYRSFCLKSFNEAFLSL